MSICRLIVLLSTVAWLGCSPRVPGDDAPPPAGVANIDHEHAAFTRLLAAHVKDGLVDYAALKREPAALSAYLATLGNVTKAQTATWSREQQLAYYINAYNAYTLKAIVDHYPVKSIRDIDGVWKKLTWWAGGERLSLDEIEHRKLRAELKEPRIHFAINCASIGCPVLPAHAFRASAIDQQLDEAARAFINDPAKVRLSDDGQTLWLSKIFDWFGEDFGGQDGVVSFCRKYLPEATAEAIRRQPPKVRWLEYDWSLNDVPR